MENGKNNFLLPNRLDAVVAKLSDKQAGVLFKGILAYANKGIMAEFEDGMVSVVFEMARQEIDYNTDQYVKTCIRNAQNGKLGGAPKGNTNAKKQPTDCLNNRNNRVVEKTTQNNPKQPKTSETSQDDVDMSCYDMNKQQRLTAAPKAAEPVSKPKRELNDLQRFSNAVIENFEQNVQTPEQKRIWFKRNCRCLSDILNFCGKSIPLALGAIEACAIRLQKANLSGGYEAVCRNLPEYMVQAQKDNLEANYASYQAS